MLTPPSSDQFLNNLFGLLQLFVELIECLTVFLPHIDHLLLMSLGLILECLLQLGHLTFTLAPAWTEGGNK